MAKYPFMTTRPGSKNQYYKRPIPKELQAPDRPTQFWKSLGTPDQKAAMAAYRVAEVEFEARCAAWRNGAVAPATAAAECLPNAALRSACDEFYQHIIDEDFAWRGVVWQKVRADNDIGNHIPHATSEWYQTFYGDLSLEEQFLCCVREKIATRVAQVNNALILGDTTGREDHPLMATLSDRDTLRLHRKLMETEVAALKDILAKDTARYDAIVERTAAVIAPTPTVAPSALKLSAAIKAYMADAQRANDWPIKTAQRKESALHEFLELVGDKPLNHYTHVDGLKFQEAQLQMPKNRQRAPFRGLPLVAVVKKSVEARAQGQKVELLHNDTINDKINAVELLFTWGRIRDRSVMAPLEDLKLPRRNKRKKKPRYPYSVDELNKLFSAPIYTGCESERRWQRPGSAVLRQSAKFWVPLIGMFTGMRLGEIIQLQVADVRSEGGISYFHVTPDTSPSAEDEDEDEKSTKNVNSHRGVPIHKTLFDVGFAAFLEIRKASGRLFPDFDRSEDDGSWSKTFSKHYTRFRRSAGVTRRGVVFHSFRHSMEDALRAVPGMQDSVRDAIQGHVSVLRYGDGHYLPTLNEALQKVEYAGLDINHLKAATASS